MTDEFDALGKVLFEKMQHLEPGFGWDPEPGPWENLTDRERDFYCTLAEAVALADRAAQRRGEQ
jgi:hypothetical protein